MGLDPKLMGLASIVNLLNEIAKTLKEISKSLNEMVKILNEQKMVIEVKEVKDEDLKELLKKVDKQAKQ